MVSEPVYCFRLTMLVIADGFLHSASYPVSFYGTNITSTITRTDLVLIRNAFVPKGTGYASFL